MPKGVYDHYKIRGRPKTIEHRLKISGENNPAKKPKNRKKIKEGVLRAYREGKKMGFLKGDENIAKKPEIGKKISEKLKGRKSEWVSKLPQNQPGHWKGEKNPKWKDGVSPLNNLIRASSQYKLWENSVLNRDNSTCQRCEEKRISKLTVHHVLNFAQYPELRFAIDNGIIFCRECHKEFHKIYGKKNNNLEQINEFIKNYDSRTRQAASKT